MLVTDRALFILDGLLEVCRLHCFHFILLFKLLEVSLLLLDDRVALNDLKFAFFELLLHLLNLALVHGISVDELRALILKRTYQTLRFLNEGLFVFDLTLL